MTTHIANAESINAICPRCKVKFGYVVEDGKVVCPIVDCHFVQPLPIIKIGEDIYFCIPCQAKRMALDVASARCVNCGGKPGWATPEVPTPG